MSPLQVQKQIRLQEARRLMRGDDLDAASAAFRAGYEDPSYFSRDYKIILAIQRFINLLLQIEVLIYSQFICRFSD